VIGDVRRLIYGLRPRSTSSSLSSNALAPAGEAELREERALASAVHFRLQLDAQGVSTGAEARV
jgi:hypothetical protein